MPSLLMLVPENASKPAHNDNHLRIPQLFKLARWQVTSCSQEHLHMHKGEVLVDEYNLRNFDLIWHLGLGKQSSFMDRMQMLDTDPENNFVNEPSALQNLHSKIAFQEFGPETYLVNNYTQVAKVLSKPGKWVLKPVAASFSENVVFFTTPTSNPKTQIDKATNKGHRYCLLQRYVEQSAEGETRCLMAGNRIIGCYRRVTQSEQEQPVHSLDKGAQAQPWTLTRAEKILSNQVIQQLNSRGIAFAAIDVVAPYLMEVNVANPGGLATLERLGDNTAAEKLATNIAKFCLPTN